jgi:hypothetical protein
VYTIPSVPEPWICLDQCGLFAPEEDCPTVAGRSIEDEMTGGQCVGPEPRDVLHCVQKNYTVSQIRKF